MEKVFWFPKIMSVQSMTTEQAACRILFNTIVKVPEPDRQQAAELALEIVQQQVGEQSELYRTVKNIHTICLVHEAVRDFARRR